MRKEFAEALEDLIDAYIENGSTPYDQIISALEMKAKALRKEQPSVES